MKSIKTYLPDKIKQDIRQDIKQWWKTNMSDWKMNKKVINRFNKLIFHETIHYKFVKNSANTIELKLYLKKAEGDLCNFYYAASCNYTYPYKFNLPKYYPKFILIEFTGFLFDFICDTLNFAIFTSFKYRLFTFLKRLKQFKVRV